MIDVKVKGEYCDIRNITYKNYKQLQVELAVLIFQVISLYGYDNKNREEDKTLTFIMDTQDFLMNFENAIKKQKGDLYEGYIDLKEQYKNIMRGNNGEPNRDKDE